jgi:hypothetical protein
LVVDINKILERLLQLGFSLGGITILGSNWRFGTIPVVLLWCAGAETVCCGGLGTAVATEAVPGPKGVVCFG